MPTIAEFELNGEQSNPITEMFGIHVKRCFFIHGVEPGQIRGEHRHRDGHTVLTCLRGSVDVYVQSPDTDSEFKLTRPTQHLYLQPEDWRVMYNFSPDCILMASSSIEYDHKDYIHEPYRMVTTIGYSLANR